MSRRQNDAPQCARICGRDCSPPGSPSRMEMGTLREPHGSVALRQMRVLWEWHRAKRVGT